MCKEEPQQQQLGSYTGWSFDAFGATPPSPLSEGARPGDAGVGDSLDGGSLLRQWPNGWYAAPADRCLAGLMPGEGEGAVALSQRQHPAPPEGFEERDAGLLPVSHDDLRLCSPTAAEEEGATGSGDSGSLFRLLQGGFRDSEPGGWAMEYLGLPRLPGTLLRGAGGTLGGRHRSPVMLHSLPLGVL